MGSCAQDSSGSEWRHVMVFCEHGNESISGGEFLG